ITETEINEIAVALEGSSGRDINHVVQLASRSAVLRYSRNPNVHPGPILTTADIMKVIHMIKQEDSHAALPFMYL
ncbi:MAG: hypothetical protein OXT67_10670, partial [Zetaproteobacteria bacterium]|nr:hypothetical protein [Zetaproteobacteria bacterium]